MLKRFEVEGFRNFGSKFTLDLSDVRDYRFNCNAIENEIIKCGVLYGRNAVGKTNFCNALFDISVNVGRGVGLRDESNYLCAEPSCTVAKFSYTFCFASGEVVYEYAKSGRRSLLVERLLINGAKVFEYDHSQRVLTGGDLSLVGANTLNWEFLDERMSVLSYICNSLPVPVGSAPLFDLYRFAKSMHPITDSFMSDRSFVSSIIEDVMKSGLVNELEGFLKYFGIAENLVVHRSPSGEEILYFEKSRPVPFVDNCSSGTIALLRLFNFFHKTSSPSFLFVDEFDAFYHHDLAERLINYFKAAKGRQVFCASHNTDLFSNKVLRPDCLFILSPTCLTSAANATKRELREGHNLEKLYKSGEFDG